MQKITDTITQGAGMVKDKGQEAINYLQSNPRIAAMLLAGGGAGLAGGMLTASSPNRATESKGSRRLRILRNALMAGGAGAGVVGLASAGGKRMLEAVPAQTEDPVSEMLTGGVSRGIAGTAGVLAGAGLGGRRDMNLSDNAAKAELAGKRKFSEPQLKGLAAELKGGKGPGANMKKYDEVAMQGFRDEMLHNPDDIKGFKPGEATAFAKARHGFTPPPDGGFLGSLFNKVPNTTHRIGMMGKSIPINARTMLKKVLGTTRAGQAARLGLVGGLAFPEITGGALSAGGALANGMLPE